MSRELQVKIDELPVGTLYENRGIWSFQYNPSWVEAGFALSPSLPLQTEEIIDTGTTRPVQWYFDNLLPEEGARTRLINAQAPDPDGTRRTWDAWRLLETFGSESAGALTLLPPGTEEIAGGLKPLPDEALEARIQRMERIPINQEAPKHMSVAGAQQKLLVCLGEDGGIYEPVGRQISSHLLKPDALSDAYPNSAVNEWFCARVARAVGLNVPPVELRYVPSSVYLIERFDREMRDGIPRRRHIIDTAQMLSIAAEYKYDRAGAEALRQVVDGIRVKAKARADIFKWVVFNILIGNGDAHLKNLSVFVSRDGYELAPHYDIVSTASWATPDLVGQGGQTWPNVNLSFRVGRAQTFAEVRADDLIEFGKAIGFPPTAANAILMKMTADILPAADSVRNEFYARTDVPENRIAGQRRMIETIYNLPVKEMARALSPGAMKLRNRHPV